MIWAKVIATGTEVIGQETVDGQTVNREQQAVFLVTDVADPDYIDYLHVATPLGSQSG